MGTTTNICLTSCLSMELDFLYVPSADVAADATYWVNVLGARLGRPPAIPTRGSETLCGSGLLLFLRGGRFLHSLDCRGVHGAHQLEVVVVRIGERSDEHPAALGRVVRLFHHRRTRRL